MADNSTMLKHLSWYEFDHAVKAIASKCPAVNGVYGEPRGGTILAVALSHHLLVPFLKKPRIGALWVDDIIDTGKTLDDAFKGMVYAAWFNKRRDYDIIVGQECGDEWLVFPWEKRSYALQDKAQYDSSRRTKNK
jgi:hypoxanthine phosphoribosyltransferase